MALALDEPIPTHIFDSRGDFQTPNDSVYIFGQSSEERSHFSDEWRANQTCQFLQLGEELPDLRVRVLPEGSDVALRSESQIEQLIRTYDGLRIQIDITGLSHHVWAPILQSALTNGFAVDVVYVEPGEYRFSDIPRAGEVFDLSERIQGISPLPGFARLGRRFDRDFAFVPLLGFEGARFQYVLEQVQPAGAQTFPVIGVPGFRPEYPFYAYEGNEPPLRTAWKDVLVAAANCPFELYDVLDGLATRLDGAVMKVAPIGTKPHSVGAVLQAIAHPDRVELVYDHPVRKPGRTEGEFRTLVYHVSVFMADRM